LIKEVAILVLIKSPMKIRLATRPLGDKSVFDDRIPNNTLIL